MRFKDWLEGVEGVRGSRPDELRALAAAARTGGGIQSSMKSGDVYFDTGPNAQNTGIQYAMQGGGGSNKSVQGQKGYVFHIDAPEDQVKDPNYAVDLGVDAGEHPEGYKVVGAMKPEFIPKFQRVRRDPRGPIKWGSGDFTIDRPYQVGKPRDLQKFITRYNSMFGSKMPPPEPQTPQ
jgi:hypothetical protein